MKIRRKHAVGILLFFLLVMLVPVQAAAAGRVRALVVSGRDLNGYKGVCQKMARALRDNKLPDYTTSPSDIRTMYFDGEAAESENGTSAEEFRAAVKNAFGKSSSSDLNVFFYTGHGTELKSGKHMIVLNKTTGMYFSDFARELAKYKGKYIVIFNACYDGAMISEGMAALSKEDQKRFTCITSVTDDRKSILNLFPNDIMKGIGCAVGYSDLKADENRDGMVTTKEISSYANALGYFGQDRVLFHFEKLDLGKDTITLYCSEGYDEITLKYKKVRRDPGILSGKSSAKWTISDKTIATVNQKGKVTAKKPGTVTVRVRYYGPLGEYLGAGDTCKITVKKPAITIKTTSGKLYVNGKKTLKAVRQGTKAAVKWSSSNKKIATVSSKGVVYGKNAGTATITAKSKDARKTYKLKVYKPTIKLLPTKLSLKVNETATIKAVISGPNKKVTWSTSSKKIGAVSKNGKVTGKKEGKVTITARANGVKAVCRVKVKGKITD